MAGSAMASPFPGMDPYLEQAIFGSEFHSRLIVALADALAPSLLPEYYVAVETRTYMAGTDGELWVGIPDAVVLSTLGSSATAQSESPAGTSEAGVATTAHPQSVILPMPLEVKERYLEIREAGSDAVITVVEVLSPTNKRQGAGRRLYDNKRQTILGSTSHLVEIDLLRAHEPMAMHPVKTGAASTARYRILVSRSDFRPRADLYEFTLRDSIPEFPLPLRGAEAFVTVDLQSLVSGIYDRSGYGIRVNYQEPVPAPSLSTVDQAWVNERLHSYRRE